MREAFSKLLEKLNSWLEAFILLLPNLVLAILFLFIFILLSRVVKKYLLKILTRYSKNVGVVSLLSTFVTTAFIIFNCGVSYNDDFFTEFADSSINFLVRFWIE